MEAAKQMRDEAERLSSLRSYDLEVGAGSETGDFASIAAQICQAPMALVGFIGAERHSIASQVGFTARELSLEASLCAQTVLPSGAPVVIRDTLEAPGLCDSPLVAEGPRVRFYAGVPLLDGEGHVLGSLCVMDLEPRDLAPEQLEALSALSRQIMAQLELRRERACLREAEGAVRAAVEELSGFNAMVIHDLRAPLRHLSAFGEILEEELGEDLSESAAQSLGFIRGAARNMDGLVVALSEYARAGSAELRIEELDISECAAIAVDSLTSRIDDSSAVVNVGRLPRAVGDQGIVVEIFQRLLENALKFRRSENPVVSIECTVDAGEQVFGVQDNGVGIAESDQEEVFRPLRRLHSAAEFEGAGLGLALVRRYVERLGGRVWVESEPGEGSHFRFTLGSESANRAGLDRS